jgi:hypothetical protein
LDDPDTVRIRDSKNLSPGDDGQPFPFIEVESNQWSTFLTAVAANQAGGEGAILFNYTEDGGVTLSSNTSSTRLTYDSDEWEAFRYGSARGDFDRH